MSDSAQPKSVWRTAKSRASRFVRIDNAVLQDARLSFRARGVLGYILSKPDRWRHSAESLSESLSRASGEGIHAVRTALTELRAAGYARLEKVRDASGHVAHRWIFSEAPSTEKPETVNDTPNSEKPHSVPSTGLPCSVEPKRGAPQCGEPSPGKTALFETTGIETTENETTVGGTIAAPAALVAFPWAAVADLPTHLQRKLSVSHNNDDALDIFQTIRGRKLRFDDRHTVADWADVFLAELDAIDREDRRTGNGRGFTAAGRRGSRYAGVDWTAEATRYGSNEPLPATKGLTGPAGWSEWFSREYPNHRDVGNRDWSALDHTTRDFIEREMARQATTGGKP